MSRFRFDIDNEVGDLWYKPGKVCLLTTGADYLNDLKKYTDKEIARNILETINVHKFMDAYNLDDFGDRITIRHWLLNQIVNHNYYPTSKDIEKLQLQKALS